MNQKKLALLLAAALALSLGSASVLAVQGGLDSPAGEAPAASQGLLPASPAAAGARTAAPEEGLEAAAPTPDPEGALTFAGLDGRVRAGSLNYLILEESIAAIEAIDYGQLQEDVRDQLNGLTDAQWMMASMGSQFSTGLPGMEPLDQALQGVAALSASAASQSLSQAHAALKDTFDDLKEGKLQEDNADLIRQLRSAQDQVVMGGETAYIALRELQEIQVTLDRSLAALDRQLQELELRHKLGQISALTLKRAQAGRASLVSSQQSVDMAVRTLTMQLENLVGAPLAGALQLGALPAVTSQALNAMDLEADLAKAKEASYSLYAAKRALEDAEEDFKDAKGKYGARMEESYQYIQAQHAWQGAQYTYENTVRSFELSFRTLHEQILDYKQVLDAAKTALSVEQSDYSAAQLRHQQGAISKNALLTAQDEVSAAQDAVAAAERNLFSAYNNYRWAVDHGILN